MSFGVEELARADELLVEPAERRAAIAGDIAGGVEAGAPVALLLHQAEPDQRLIAGDEDLLFGQVVFVVETDLPQSHSARSSTALNVRRRPGLSLPEKWRHLDARAAP